MGGLNAQDSGTPGYGRYGRGRQVGEGQPGGRSDDNARRLGSRGKPPTAAARHRRGGSGVPFDQAARRDERPASAEFRGV